MLSSKVPRHSRLEDVHALLMGASFIAFGLVLLKAAGLVTAGVAGIALILSYSLGWPVGPLFLLINLPFFVLAQRRMGWLFTAKSMLALIVVTYLSRAMTLWLRLDDVRPAFAAIFGGSLVGTGVLSLARHRSSAGGIGILGLFLQESRGWSAGLIQLAFDLFIIAASLAIIGLERAVYSVLSAVALNVVMLAYHRPGRYVGY